MHHMPHITTFLSGRHLSIVPASDNRWRILTATHEPLLDFATHTHSGESHIELFVSTAMTSTDFPQTPGAQSMFDAEESSEWLEEAFDWLDDFTDTLHEDIGDYTCTVTTGAADVRRFEAKGYTAKNDDTHRLTKHLSR